MKTWVPHWVVYAALSVALFISSPLVHAQALSRIVGTVTAANGNTLTVKTDAGELHQVEVPATAILKRIAPGQTTLSGAETIKFSDLTNGDRVLVNLNPSAPAGTLQASAIIAIKETDLAKRQEQEREEWQRNGVGGLVKSVDPATGVIVLTSGAGPMAKTITIHTTKTTILKRYAPASVRYDDAKPEPIAAIQPGDQLRARGTKNGEGTELTAEEVVSGSFRNVSGKVETLNTANSTLTLKDLVTKKMVTIHVTPTTQMHRLPDQTATMLAAVLKGNAGRFGRRGGGAMNGGRGGFARGSGQSGGPGGGGGGAGRGEAGDMSQILSRSPVIHFPDLKKGDVVMLVSTPGTSDVTAITLVAGVEPLLEAPAGEDLLSSWSMDSGAGASEGAQ
ncbi:MAG: hypothetical protein KGL37_13185 [Acidobacteriota bacterium]|nr:hypothetical protein [Acidobacteriota bacterium]